MEQAERLLRMSEVVKITGYGRAKAYAMAASGELPVIKHNRSVRVPANALQRWIERNMQGGEATR